jgi:hypothetical protein
MPGFAASVSVVVWSLLVVLMVLNSRPWYFSVSSAQVAAELR